MTDFEPNLDYLRPMCGGGAGEMEDLGKNQSPTQPLDNLCNFKAIVDKIISAGITEKKDMDKLLHKERKIYRCNIPQTDLLFAYRVMCQEGKYKMDQKIVNLFQKKSHRSQSGVMVVAIFTSPYPNGQKFSCEYDCWYCPNEPDQPRSYLLNEPGVLRANRNKFDCIDQMYDRLKTYHTIGHPTDKLEVIVLGGTWSSYPSEYRETFIRDMYYAANTYHIKISDGNIPEPTSLESEMFINRTARAHVIGLTIETRPDRITPKDLKEFRKMGVTRVQIGIQHTNDRILERINRKCKTVNSINGIRLLKDAGFKVDIHIMPNLPLPLKEGVNPNKAQFELDDIDQTVDMVEEDRKMFDKFLFDPLFSADQWKIYPCEVVPWTRLEDEYKRGIYVPYAHQEAREMNELHHLLMDVKSKVPRWVRLNRIIRDIPNQYILGGPKDVSMRQLLEIKMKERGIQCNCIRCREVKKQEIDTNLAIMFVDEYDASDGKEIHISFETCDRNVLFSFLRLRLSEHAGKYFSRNTWKVMFPELVDCAMIREVHVYGQTTAVHKGGDHHQHVGFGTQMIKKAFEIAFSRGYKKISVISGEGVKSYYERFGFRDESHYMTGILEKSVDSNDIVIKTVANTSVSGDMLCGNNYLSGICKYLDYVNNSNWIGPLATIIVMISVCSAILYCELFI